MRDGFGEYLDGSGRGLIDVLLRLWMEDRSETTVHLSQGKQCFGQNSKLALNK
jgi:hypothetical protein